MRPEYGRRTPSLERSDVASGISGTGAHWRFGRLSSAHQRSTMGRCDLRAQMRAPGAAAKSPLREARLTEPWHTSGMAFSYGTHRSW